MGLLCIKFHELWSLQICILSNKCNGIWSNFCVLISSVLWRRGDYSFYNFEFFQSYTKLTNSYRNGNWIWTEQYFWNVWKDHKCFPFNFCPRKNLTPCWKGTFAMVNVFLNKRTFRLYIPCIGRISNTSRVEESRVKEINPIKHR